MAKTKEQKGEIIAKLEEGIKSATSTVFVHFSRITVAEESAMRNALRESGVKYMVAKKTLIRRALEALGHKADDVALDGEVAVAYGGGEDATVAARLIHETGRKLVDPLRRSSSEASKLSILGGIFEGKIVGAGAMQEIATIPSMLALRGMFANIINSPRQRFAIGLSEVAKTKTS